TIIEEESFEGIDNNIIRIPRGAQAILDSANITIPTGNLVDSCYDELAKDVNIKINTKLDTIATLKIKLCIDQGIDIKRSLVRLFFLGSLLDDKLKLEDLDYSDEQVLQALISEKP
ncbi:11061_t:CDS:2, partial [Diversispora eburnea]